MLNRKLNVLFVCNGNSARSQMAEALLRHQAGDRFNVFSAGLKHVGSVHPLALQALDEIGVSTEGLRSKGTQEYLGRMRIDYAIIVCSATQQDCPRIEPFASHTLHWPFDDPAAAEGSDEEKLDEFRRVRDEIEQRLAAWVEELAVCGSSLRT